LSEDDEGTDDRVERLDDDDSEDEGRY